MLMSYLCWWSCHLFAIYHLAPHHLAFAYILTIFIYCANAYEFVKLRGSVDPECVNVAFQKQTYIVMHTFKGGPSPFCKFFVGLSSNTKKGEIERIFPN